MTHAFAPPTLAVAAPAALVVDAARCWRDARDRGHIVLPILFARLELRRAGFLAPAIDALLAMLEAWSGQRFATGAPAAPTLTDDERQLLALLDSSPPPSAARAARPGLTDALYVALRSTRIILRSVLGHEALASAASAAHAPIFFAKDDKAQPEDVGPEQKAIMRAEHAYRAQAGCGT